MDFKQLRLCKRIALEGQKMSLETISWPATSRCQEQQGRPVSRQPDEIYWAPSLVTVLCDIVSSLRQPHWQSCLRETSCQTLFPLMKSCKWTDTMIVHRVPHFMSYFITLRKPSYSLQVSWLKMCHESKLSIDSTAWTHPLFSWLLN